jgi:hypothetical protein
VKNPKIKAIVEDTPEREDPQTDIFLDYTGGIHFEQLLKLLEDAGFEAAKKYKNRVADLDYAIWYVEKSVRSDLHEYRQSKYFYEGLLFVVIPVFVEKESLISVRSAEVSCRFSENYKSGNPFVARNFRAVIKPKKNSTTEFMVTDVLAILNLASIIDQIKIAKDNSDYYKILGALEAEFSDLNNKPSTTT